MKQTFETSETRLWMLKRKGLTAIGVVKSPVLPSVNTTFQSDFYKDHKDHENAKLEIGDVSETRDDDGSLAIVSAAICAIADTDPSFSLSKALEANDIVPFGREFACTSSHSSCRKCRFMNGNDGVDLAFDSMRQIIPKIRGLNSRGE